MYCSCSEKKEEPTELIDHRPSQKATGTEDGRYLAAEGGASSRSPLQAVDIGGYFGETFLLPFRHVAALETHSNHSGRTFGKARDSN